MLVRCSAAPAFFRPADLADFSLESLEDEGSQAPSQAINGLYCMTKYFKEMNAENRESFVECMVAKVGHFLDAIEKENTGGKFDKKTKDFFKICFFLFIHSMSTIEDVISEENAAAEAAVVPTKGKKKKAAAPIAGAIDWVTLRKVCLITLERVLAVPANHLWTMGSIHENFLAAGWQYVVKILEAKPIGIKTGLGGFDKEMRSMCIRIVAKSVSHFGNPESSGSYPTLISGLLESLMRTEHMTAVTAEICQACTPMLTREFLEEVSSINEGKQGQAGTSSSSAATAGMKHIGIFIEDLAKFNSSTMIANLPIIMKQLDSDAHQVRSSLLQALAHLVILLDKSLKGDTEAVEAVSKAGEEEVIDMEEDGEQEKEQREGENVAEKEGAGEDREKENALGGKLMSPRLRDTILDVIVERTHDVSPYTRAAVLRVWHSLLVANAVPVRRLGNVSEIAYDRLFDKAQAVRKNALALVTAVLEHNPYGGNLDNLQYQRQRVIFQAKLAERIEQLKTAHIEAKAVEPKPVPDTLPEGMEMPEGIEKIEEGEKDEDGDDDAFNMDVFMESPEVKEDSDVVAIRQGLEYCNSALEVIATLLVASVRVKAMLKSKSAAEVVEALRLITSLVNFSVRGSIQLYFKSADLIFHADKSVVTECKNAFRNIFLVHGDTLLAPAEIAENLMEVFAQCDDSCKKAVEAIVTSMFAADGGSGVDDVAVSSCLWSVVSNSQPQSPKVGTALRILTLMASNGPDDSAVMTWSRIATVIRNGMSSSVISHFNFDAVQAAAMFLGLLPPEQSTFDMESEKGQVFASAVERFVCVILGEMCGDSETQSSRWFAACEECIQTLFRLHPSPDHVMARVVSAMYATLSTSISGEKVVCSNARLSRFFFVLGQTALNSLVLAENLSQMTRSRKLAAQKEAIAAEQAKRGSKKISDQEAEHDAEMTAAIDMELETELFKSLNEDMLLENLLSKFVPMVAAVVASDDSEKSYASVMLRQTATLSLCKFMSVSATVCEKYLPLLFTSLENNPDEACRTTIMVAIGDLMSRFPNSLEQWTAYIYARLCDHSTVVRYNSLMVLTHMLLNDMVKVKGQIVNVVLCLCDTDERIRDLSRLFFLKLAERSLNPLHNQMGEVIATITREMSDGERGVLVTGAGPTAEGSSVGSKRKVLSSAEYATTLDFLLSFVKVIKQADALLERTLPRLILAQTTTQKRALALCLSKLTVSPKGVKKVGESVKSLKDALCDEEVYNCLLKCVRGVKKSTAVGTSSSLTENEKKDCKEVEEEIIKVGREAHVAGADQEGAAQQDGKEGEGEAAGEDGTAATEELIKGLQQSKENMVGGQEGEAAAAPTPAKKGKKGPAKRAPAKTRPSRKKAAVVESEDEDDDIQEEQEPKARSRRTRRPLAAAN